MTGREKIQRALSAGGTDAFGAVICYPGIYLRERWEELAGVSYGWEADGDPAKMVEVQKRFVRALGIDWTGVGLGETREFRERHAVEIEEREAYLLDRETGKREAIRRPPPGGEFIAPGPQKGMPRSKGEINEIVGREMGSLKGVEEDGRLDCARLARRELPEMFLVSHVLSPYWAMEDHVDFLSLMTMGIEAPELCAHFVEGLTGVAARKVRALSGSGADAFWIEECMTDQLSPGLFREFVLPGVRTIVDEIRRCGLASIYYYCGSPHDRLELLLEAGADALALEEGKKGFAIDIAEIEVRVAGRCALFGNLDAVGVLERMSPDTLRREVAKQLEAARRRGRFVMSTGSPVTPGTSPERVREYTDLVHELS
ncbi:MAG: uroporphyrinogen decarboxylase family protein [Planctomycetota bacterium]